MTRLARAADDGDLDAWLWLLHTPGVGREGARRLLARLGSPRAVCTASVAARRGCVSADAAQALARPPEGHVARLRATLDWLAAGARRRVLVLGDADYPVPLLNTADPPLLLYLDGRAELLAAASLAIVGSRTPTPQGRENARAFARALCGRGWTIVSGLAAGIDGAAHEGALAALDGDGERADSHAASTIAVVGTGLDIAYPRSHRALAERVAAQGLMVSEYALGTAPLPAHFPLRNRIIAGLTRGTLVVEAGLKSGSLITARLAAEGGREVMAVPGSIHSPTSRGCHALIRQGAALVESVDDVVAELGPPDPEPAATDSAAGAAPHRSAEPRAADTDAAARDEVLDALGHDPASLDDLIARSGWTAPRLAARLLTLELDGRVARLPGGRYQRLHST